MRFLATFALLALCLLPAARLAGLLPLAFIVPALLAGLFAIATRKEA